MSRRPVVAFRTTAGKGIGLGHLRRCLTLAGALAQKGAEPRFWLDGDAAVGALVERAGWAWASAGDEPAASLALGARERPDALVADSYALGEAYFRRLRAELPLLVIDDLADRALDADLVQNAAPEAEALDYRVGAGARLLLGPRYALLGPSFAALPARRADEVRRVLVTLGGADPEGRTALVVRGLLGLAELRAALDVVVGPLYGDAGELEALERAEPARLRLHRALPELSALMREADLAVSGGGQTLFELAAAGVPTVALEVADNQRVLLAGFARAGTLLGAGPARGDDLGARIAAALGPLAADPARRQRMSDAGQALVDGRGAERVADALLAVITEKKERG